MYKKHLKHEFKIQITNPKYFDVGSKHKNSLFVKVSNKTYLKNKKLTQLLKYKVTVFKIWFLAQILSLVIYFIILSILYKNLL